MAKTGCEKKRGQLVNNFSNQLKDAIILIAAAVISFAIACAEGDPKEFFAPILILLIVALNAIMSAMWESKAKKFWMC